MIIKIEHIAIWVSDLEKIRNFYTHYFDMQCSEKYINKNKGFSSYFLSFKDGARIEIMHRSDIPVTKTERGNTTGLAHIAISVSGKDNVDVLTEKLRQDGYRITGEPRTTGDGYYESVVADPEGNLVEITE